MAFMEVFSRPGPRIETACFLTHCSVFFLFLIELGLSSFFGQGVFTSVNDNYSSYLKGFFLLFFATLWISIFRLANGSLFCRGDGLSDYACFFCEVRDMPVWNPGQTGLRCVVSDLRKTQTRLATLLYHSLHRLTGRVLFLIYFIAPTRLAFSTKPHSATQSFVEPQNYTIY